MVFIKSVTISFTIVTFFLLKPPRKPHPLVGADERRGNRRYGDCQITLVASGFQYSAWPHLL